MLKISTNTSSIIVQNSLKNSTLNLNQAVERMSTGLKINHAKDNAANYSISTNMSTKISGYQVAEDNAAMGLDLIATASDSLSLISNHLSRLRDLAEQAANGTNGAQSLKAINAEVNARVDEMLRLYNTTEYNGQKLFGEIQECGFIQEVVERDTSTMTKLESVDANTTISSGAYSISSAEELAKLAEMTNRGKVTGGLFVLANDIDLSAYSSGEGWTPIGNNSNRFTGAFDGNGHVISNLCINRPNETNVGLFGYTANGALIKNLGLKNCDIVGEDYCGTIIGYQSSTMIDNSYAIGNVSGDIYVGGLVGLMDYDSLIKSSCTMGNVYGTKYVGGLAGKADYVIETSYSKSNVRGNERIGGLVGEINNYFIESCYATGNVTGKNYTGGLIGYATTSYTFTLININNCHATGDVSGENYTGGLIGDGYKANIESSYATGNVNGRSYVGGLVGHVANNTIKSSYAMGDVSGERQVGGLLGYSNSTIKSSYATGNVTGENLVGGFAGYSCGTIKSSYAMGDVNGKKSVGGFIGHAWEAIIESSYSSGDVVGNDMVGGFAGYAIGGITSSYSTGNVSGNTDTAAFAGFGDYGMITNSYSSGQATKNGSMSSDFIGRVNSLTVDSASKTLADGEEAPFVYNYLSADINKNKTASAGLSTNFHVGINGDQNSQIHIETSFDMNEILNLRIIGIGNSDYLSNIDALLNKISTKQTEYGSAQNRLESALEEISTQYENLVSSRSTLRDADIAKETSNYIKNQILQEASATLLSTANQSPALALQLL